MSRSHHLVNAHELKPVRLLQSLCAVSGSNIANVDSGNIPGRLKLDNNNVQLQTIYSMYTSGCLMNLVFAMFDVMANSRTFKDLCNEI